MANPARAAAIEGRADRADQGVPQNEPVPQTLPAYRALDLTTGGKRAHILHGDQVYTLSITRAGKLILTK